MARILALMLRLPLLLPFLLALPASAADDIRVSFLEQEVRNLQRQVQALSRQLDDLRTRPERLGSRAAVTAAPADFGVAANLPRWVDPELWKKLRTGMNELEVVSSLGPPTSMREESGATVLLYALEIGASGFLGGSVKLRDRAVVEIRQPTLQ